MKYESHDRNQRHVQAISKHLNQQTPYILLPTLIEKAKPFPGTCMNYWKKKNCSRQAGTSVVFHEITKKAVTEAIAHPEQLATNLINAQQARRALDYLVGFNLSPLLWKKIRRGLSAGRVQSPALRMIVEARTGDRSL